MGLINVLVCGACGKMGLEVLKAVNNDKALNLVGGVDINAKVADVGEVLGLGILKKPVFKDLQVAIEKLRPEIIVDFTSPAVVMSNLRIAMMNKIAIVVGTTGFTEENIAEIRILAEDSGVGVLIAPNFAIGAVLMMKMAEEAAQYLPHVEIIEMHHDQKLDAPSGTAFKTAERIREKRGEFIQGHPNEKEIVDNVRGGDFGGIKIHSVRLPGYVAHQEVIFGGLGQILTIRHDSISRESFMPGVVMACKKMATKKGLIYGLEHLL